MTTESLPRASNFSHADFRRLKGKDLEVFEKLGLFSVPEGTKDLKLVRAADAAVKKYIARFEKEGWLLESRPKVKRVPMWQPKVTTRVSASGEAILHIEDGPGMRPDHPWYADYLGKDLYQVLGWWSRPPRIAHFEIADETLSRLVEQGKLPASIKVVE
jgi:hypothetical protein